MGALVAQLLPVTRTPTVLRSHRIREYRMGVEIMRENETEQPLETDISYHIQERCKIGGIVFPWQTVPVGWSTRETAFWALEAHIRSTGDDMKDFRVVKVTTEVMQPGSTERK